MKEETKLKLINSIPFQVLLLLFVIACIVSDYYYKTEVPLGQHAVWGTFVTIVIGFLIYIKVKNR